jgi:hypothetical protein
MGIEAAVVAAKAAAADAGGDISLVPERGIPLYRYNRSIAVIIL